MSAPNEWREQPPGFIRDTDNEQPAPLGAGETFVGDWRRIGDHSAFALLYATNVAPAAVQIQWSKDGVTQDTGVLNQSNMRVTPLSGFHIAFAVHNLMLRPYYRLRVVNGPTAQLVAYAYAGVLSAPYTGTFAGITDPIAALSVALLTRSVLIGDVGNNTYQPVKVTNRGGLRTEDQRLEVDLFGGLATSTRVDEIAVSYHEDVLATLTDVVLSGGALASVVESQLRLSTGSAATARSQVTSRDRVRYRPGHEINALFTAAWPVPGVASSNMRIGLFDDDNGMFVGYQGTAFGVTTRRAGVDTFVASTAWNGDKMTGDKLSTFQRQAVPEALDLTKVNIYRLRFGWLGSAPVIWDVLSPDGIWVEFHRIHQPNSALDVHVLDPNLPIRAEVEKVGADATDLLMRSGSWSGAVRGTPPVTQLKDEGNSFHAPPGTAPTVAAPFVGRPFPTLGRGVVGTTFSVAGQAGKSGTVIFNYSPSGDQTPANVPVRVPLHITNLGDPLLVPLQNVEDYFWLEFVPDDNTLTELHIATIHHRQAPLPLVRFLNQTISDNEAVGSARAYLSARKADGTWPAVGFGQTEMVNSLPVTLALDQSSVPVSGTFWPNVQQVSGTVVSVPATFSKLHGVGTGAPIQVKVGPGVLHAVVLKGGATFVAYDGIIGTTNKFIDIAGVQEFTGPLDVTFTLGLRVTVQSGKTFTVIYS